VLASIGPTGAWSMAGISMNGNALSTVSALSYFPNYTMSLQPVTATAAWNNGAAVRVNPTYNIAGTSVANTDLLVNRTETSLGTTPGTQLLLDLQIGGVSKVSIAGTGVASVPGVLGSGTWFTGGTSTTTKPYLLIEPSGTTSNGWSTSGTGIGVNAASGFAGNLLALQVAGADTFRVDSNGQVLIGNTLALSSGAGSNLLVGSGFTKTQLSTGIISFGGTTSSFPALKRSTTGLIARLADDSADTWVKTLYVQTNVVAVASLPACNAGLEGSHYGVNNALAPTALATVVGGGAVHVSVYCDGTNWIVN